MTAVLPARTAPGDAATLRAVGPDDLESMRGFVDRLSADTLYQRFFAGVGRVPDRVLRLLLADDDGRRSGWIAEHDGDVVGHAGCVLLAGVPGPIVDVSVVVADAWQGRGLGRRLVERAVRAAAPAAVQVTVLAGNRRAIRLVQHFRPGIRATYRDGTGSWLLPVPAL